ESCQLGDRRIRGRALRIDVHPEELGADGRAVGRRGWIIAAAATTRERRRRQDKRDSCSHDDLRVEATVTRVSAGVVKPWSGDFAERSGSERRVARTAIEEAHQLGAAAHLEGVEDAVHVMLDRADGDPQLFADLLVTISVANHHGDVALAIAETVIGSEQRVDVVLAILHMRQNQKISADISRFTQALEAHREASGVEREADRARIFVEKAAPLRLCQHRLAQRRGKRRRCAVELGDGGARPGVVEDDTSAVLRAEDEPEVDLVEDGVGWCAQRTPPNGRFVSPYHAAAVGRQLLLAHRTAPPASYTTRLP